MRTNTSLKYTAYKAPVASSSHAVCAARGRGSGTSASISVKGMCTKNSHNKPSRAFGIGHAPHMNCVFLSQSMKIPQQGEPGARLVNQPSLLVILFAAVFAFWFVD